MSLFCLTCFSMGDLGTQVSIRSSVRQHSPWVSCERNSSYSFIPIVLKLCMCFLHGMRMCMWFAIIVRLFFVTFSTSVYRQLVPRERNSSYNFIPIFLKLSTCFLHGLKMCIWFGYNPCINFVLFFHFVNFVIFWPQILWKCIDNGTFWARLLIQFLAHLSL